MKPRRNIIPGRRGIAAAISAALAVGLLSFATYASADPLDGKAAPPPGSGPDQAELQVPEQIRLREAKLVPVAEDIDAAVDPADTGRPTVADAAGYLLLRVDSEQNKLILYWHGELSASVQRIISEHPDVRVEVRPSDYTESQYMDAQDSLERLLSQRARGTRSVQLMGIEHFGDLTGFTVLLYDPRRELDTGTLKASFSKSSRLDLELQIDYVTSVDNTDL